MDLTTKILNQLSLPASKSELNKNIYHKNTLQKFFLNDQFDFEKFDLATMALGFKRGIEKESLRITPEGKLAETPHPYALGSALTCSHITTDFSEGLLEIITAPHYSASDLFSEMLSLQQFSQNHLAEEIFWSSSMPPQVLDPLQIHLADYGLSAMGQMKRIYREGLALRYGKIMQIISGVHFNFSIPDRLMQQLCSIFGMPASDIYLAQVRQMLRDMWILPYLFGASPAASRTSISGSLPAYLKPHAKHSVLSFEATSLRLGDLGYRNKGEDLISIDYNTVDGYADSLYAATQKKYPPYTDLALANTFYRQLNDSLLQVENEYYIPVRPKQITNSGEVPSRALLSRGVQYVELRALDVDPMTPLGITPQCVAFLDVFMLASLFSSSEPFLDGELALAQENLQKVATYGLRPGLMLRNGSKKLPLVAAADHIFERLDSVAAWMDEQHNQGPIYKNIVAAEYKKLHDPSLTPAKKIVNSLCEANIDYDTWVLRQSYRNKNVVENHPIDKYFEKKWQSMVDKSRKEYSLL